MMPRFIPRKVAFFSPYRGRAEKMFFGTLSGFSDAFHASDSVAGRFRLDPYVVVPNQSPGAQGPKSAPKEYRNGSASRSSWSAPAKPVLKLSPGSRLGLSRFGTLFLLFA